MIHCFVNCVTPNVVTPKKSSQKFKLGHYPTIWNLPLSPNISDNSLVAVASAFAPGGSADLAGKCGLESVNPTTKPRGTRH